MGTAERVCFLERFLSFKAQLIHAYIKMEPLTIATTSFTDKSILWILRTLTILSILLTLSYHGLGLVTISFGFVYQIRIIKITDNIMLLIQVLLTSNIA